MNTFMHFIKNRATEIAAVYNINAQQNNQFIFTVSPYQLILLTIISLPLSFYYNSIA